MVNIQSKISEIYSLEQLSSRNTCIHSIHPLAKVLGTFTYIICTVSFGHYEFSRLVPFIFYPVLLMSLAEVPYRMIGKRTLIALPFCLFAGVSNLFFDRTVMLRIWTFSVSFGAVSFFTIMFRTLLCVAVVLILVSITPFTELTGQMHRMYVPSVFISLFEMTYRYIGALLEEASSTYTSYRLRSRTTKGLEMKHMGSFIGQLLIRSFDRAERVYQAMKCRGYALGDVCYKKRPLNKADVCFFVLSCGSSILFRCINVPLLLGRLF